VKRKVSWRPELGCRAKGEKKEAKREPGVKDRRIYKEILRKREDMEGHVDVEVEVNKNK
jgi:hypothetical protein